jgi:hypothetical protein
MSSKHGGTQTHFWVNFSGIINKTSTYGVETTIRQLVNSCKNRYVDRQPVKVDLHYRGRLVSSYPLDRRVFDVLVSDDPEDIKPIYNIITSTSTTSATRSPSRSRSSPSRSPPKSISRSKSRKSP